MSVAHGVVGSFIVAGGMVWGASLLANGFVASRTSDDFVTVKGLSEREVEADLAVWPLRFVATSDDLEAAQAKLAEDEAAIRAFLDESGIDASAVEVVGLAVTDRLANPYQSGPIRSRFIVAKELKVRTADVEAIANAAQRIGDVVAQGVIITEQHGNRSQPTYVFTKLVELKPGMVAEATKNARAAADSFAEDSGARLGGIRRARQGLFQILPRDHLPGEQEHQQRYKRIRVVSTIEFRLETGK